MIKHDRQMAILMMWLINQGATDDGEVFPVLYIGDIVRLPIY